MRILLAKTGSVKQVADSFYYGAGQHQAEESLPASTKVSDATVRHPGQSTDEISRCDVLRRNRSRRVGDQRRSDDRPDGDDIERVSRLMSNGGAEMKQTAYKEAEYKNKRCICAESNSSMVRAVVKTLLNCSPPSSSPLA